MLPTFLVIGAQKGGTTSLYQALDRHPEVFVAREKELNFFCDPGYARGIAWYEEQFAAAGDAKARGEVSPYYTSYPWKPDVPERVARHLPGVRLVYMLRNPIDRMVSNYRHHVAIGNESRPMDRALFVDSWQYLDRSRYAMQLERWLEHVDRESILIITTEDLRDKQAETMSQIARHIGVDEHLAAEVPAQRANVGAEYRRDRGAAARLRRSAAFPALRALVPAAVRRRVWRTVASEPLPPEVRDPDVSADLRRRLVDALRPDLERLRDHLGGDFHCWGLLDEAAADADADLSVMPD